MSGGVDSSVAAWLLQQQNYDVEGLFMKNWEQDDTEQYCAAAQDLADAKTVCQILNIPLHTINFANQYWDNVFSIFLQEYRRGRTPNPDVLCNKEIKFKAFFTHAMDLGADYIATGHYANVKQGKLFQAKDRLKDQTYFLNAIHPDTLKKTIFPLGDFLKADVRQLAKQLNLPNHHKKDSTGICFIGEKRFKSFLQEYILNKPGDIISTEGQHLGRHEGLMFYTLGQRQGLGIGGGYSASNLPWFVVDKDFDQNQLIVAAGQNHPMLYAEGLVCERIHWLEEALPQFPLSCYAKIRYRQMEQACLISDISRRSGDQDNHYVMFSQPQRAITPGQYIVFYRNHQCLGGAIIEGIIR